MRSRSLSATTSSNTAWRNGSSCQCAAASMRHIGRTVSLYVFGVHVDVERVTDRRIHARRIRDEARCAGTEVEQQVAELQIDRGTCREAAAVLRAQRIVVARVHTELEV